MPVLPVPREGPVQEDELQESRAAVVVLWKSPQQGEGRGPEGAPLSGRLLLRRRVVGRLRRGSVSDESHWCW